MSFIQDDGQGGLRSSLTRGLFSLSASKRPLDGTCGACGAESLEVIQALAWDQWSGTVACKACGAKTSLAAHMGHKDQEDSMDTTPIDFSMENSAEWGTNE